MGIILCNVRDDNVLTDTQHKHYTLSVRMAKILDIRQIVHHTKKQYDSQHSNYSLQNDLMEIRLNKDISVTFSNN